MASDDVVGSDEAVAAQARMFETPGTPWYAVSKGTLADIQAIWPETPCCRPHHNDVSLDSPCGVCGCTADVEVRPGYPAVVNDPGATRNLRDAAGRVLGTDRIVETAPLAAAEDFAYFLEQVPGAFALLGAGNVERGIVAPHHSPAFDIDESVLPLGARILAELATEQP